jgi:hypothetical protein
MIEPVRQRLAAYADADLAHIGEIGEPKLSGLVDLPEGHLLIQAMERSP